MAGGDQRGYLVAPGVSGLGETVRQHDSGPRSCHPDTQGDVVGDHVDDVVWCGRARIGDRHVWVPSQWWRHEQKYELDVIFNVWLVEWE